jgi:hypothetical protein
MPHEITFPAQCVQATLGNWWIRNDTAAFVRGRLIWTFVPYVSQEPRVLVLEGRSEPTDHRHANFRIETMKGMVCKEPAVLPVAAFPHHDNEKLIVSRAKRRPALVLSTDGLDVPRTFRLGKSKHQTSPTVLVAPYFGAALSQQRAGFHPDFIMRIRACDYPQFIWDKLPLGGDTEESILRLNHTFPIGNDPAAYEITPWVLSEEALEVIDEWFNWLITGKLNNNGILYMIRDGLRQELGV